MRVCVCVSGCSIPFSFYRTETRSSSYRFTYAPNARCAICVYACMCVCMYARTCKLRESKNHTCRGTHTKLSAIPPCGRSFKFKYATPHYIVLLFTSFYSFSGALILSRVSVCFVCQFTCRSCYLFANVSH